MCASRLAIEHLMTPTDSRADLKRTWRLLWLASAVFTVYAAALPFHFDGSQVVAREHLTLAIQQALAGPFDLPLPDVVQNVLLYIPFGIFGAASLKRGRSLHVMIAVPLLATMLSGSCEVLQLFTIDRTTSVWDIFTNIAGATIGAAAWITLQPAIQKIGARISLSSPQVRQAFPVACSAALVCIAALEPFDISLDVGSAWSKVKPFVYGPVVVWQPITDEPLTALRFAFLTVLLVDWFRAWRNDLPARSVTFLCTALLGVSLELTQFLIASRSPSIQDLLAVLAGILAGMFVGPIATSSVRPVAMLVVASAIAAVPFYLQPFTVASVHRPLATVPFLSYYEFTSRQTVSHVIDIMLIYAPIAFAIEWTQTRRSLLRAVVLSAVIASSLEYSQGWIVGRFPDVTDVGMALLGALAGVWMACYGEALASA